MTEPRNVIAHPLLSRMPTTPNEWAEYNRVLLDLFNTQQRRIEDLETRVNALENP